MPAARAAASREPPSSARASIRRAARASRHRAASRRSSPPPSSRRVIATTIGPLPTGPYRRINRRGPRDAPGTRPVRNNGRWYDGLPERVLGSVELPERGERHVRAEAFILATNADILYGQGKAAYLPTRDQIYLPERGAFEGIEHFYATALHELGHWTGHERRMNRDLSNRFGTQAYAAEELVAELT